MKILKRNSYYRPKITLPASLGLLVIGLFLAFSLPNLKIDFELESLFPQNDREIKYYESIIQDKGYDNDFILVTFIPEKAFFDSLFLNRTNEFIQNVNQTQTVTEVESPLIFDKVIKTPIGLSTIPLIHIDDPGKYQYDSLRISESDFYSRAFVKNTLIPVYIKHQHFKDDNKKEEFLKILNIHLDNSGLEFIYTGKLFAEKEFKNYLKKDFGGYLIFSLLMCFLIILLLYKSILKALLPLIVASLTLFYTFGVMAVLGLSINIMSVLLPPILLFSSTSDAIHLINAIQSKGKKDGIKQVFMPTLLTSITTSAGFLSLFWMDVSPIVDFGVAASIGVFFAFVFTYIIIPSSVSIKQADANQKILNFNFIQSLALKNSKITLIFSCILITVLGLGIYKLEVDAYLLKDLPADSNVRRSFDEMDNKLGGSKPWMVNFTSEKSIWNDESLEEIEILIDFMRNKMGVVFDNSPISYIKESNSVYNVNVANSNSINLAKRLSRENSDSSFLYTGLIPEYGSKKTNEYLKQLKKLDSESPFVSLRPTGTTYLIDKSHILLSQKLIKGILFAFLLISLLLSIYFKSLKWILITLVPNILTLVSVAGIIGWLGIPLQLTNAIIFIVSFGIVVDDTIHFLACYFKHHKSESNNAVELTLQNTGKSIIYTSIILLAGFSIFTISSFGATFQFGLFLFISIFIAVIVDIIFLPALLKFMEQRK